MIIFIALAAIKVVRIKTVVPFWVDHQDFRNLLFQDQLINGLVKMAVTIDDPAGMIVVESMEEINHRVAFLALVIGRGKENGVLSIFLQGRTGKAAKHDLRAARQLNGVSVFELAFVFKRIKRFRTKTQSSRFPKSIQSKG